MRMSVGVGLLRFYSNGRRMSPEGRGLLLLLFITLMTILIAIKFWYVSLPLIAIGILTWKLYPAARKQQAASKTTDKPGNQASVSNRR